MADWNVWADVTDTPSGAALRYLTDAMRVQRFHCCVPMLVKQTIGEHSAEVAAICDLLSPGGFASARLLRAAIRHDLPELTWGDVPGPAKRLMGNDKLEAAEAETLRSVHLHDLGGPLLPAEARILEIADRVSGALHCVYERSLGHMRAKIVFSKYISWLDEHRPYSVHEQAVLDQLSKLWMEVST